MLHYAYVDSLNPGSLYHTVALLESIMQTQATVNTVISLLCILVS
jgi:hypothetical protein